MNMQQLFTVETGKPYPLGASTQKNGINLALYSLEKETTLCLFNHDTQKLLCEIPLDPNANKTGDIWHILIHNLPDNLYYAYRASNTDKFLLDPYAKTVSSGNRWGKSSGLSSNEPNYYHPLGGAIANGDFNWEGIQSPKIPLKELIIYEMHVRGFTCHPSSQANNKGTFLGIIEKIPHLVDLGINAVELMPIHEFNEMEYLKENPISHEKLYNYWGYSTVNFFSPMNRYNSSENIGTAIKEFKTLVKELHRNGIEVILDVVFNHTAEGNENGPIYSFKGFANSVYYMLDSHGKYLDFTGCGNTVNCNRPAVREFIVDCLRYWTSDMQVDGFRFDLASIFSRDYNGNYLPLSPIIDEISQDPVLSQTKLIAEPWDAVGLYEVGRFYPQQPRWAEWNGKYRDTVRRFIKGTPGVKGEFATRLCGSQDLYHSRAPYCSINFVTSHDGFTLYDLVSYNHKHNIENGEDNRDGFDANDSWNCGTEGPSVNKKVIALRERQMRNFHIALMVSHGVPMLLMGDEYAHTRKGNNNAWCQDNELNWFLWDQLKDKSAFFNFYRKLIHFRKVHPILKNEYFLTNNDVEWHGCNPLTPEWETHFQFLAFTLKDLQNQNDLYIAFNAHDQFVNLQFPQNAHNKTWHWIANTANLPPQDFFDVPQAIASISYKMMSHSALILKAL